MTDLGAREQRRLAALAKFEVMDTPRESAFDELAELVAAICEAPIGVVNLIGECRQFFKAEVGLGVRETPLDTSFCAHALLEQDFLLVPDATADPRFACNPLVTGEPHIRFYAGALLKTDDGLPIGTLCVLDYQPRQLSDVQIRSIRVLARQVMAQLEQRLAARQVAASEARQRAIMDSAQDFAIVTTDLDGHIVEWTSGAKNVLGWSRDEVIGIQIQDLTNTGRVVDALTQGLSSLAAGDLNVRLDTPFSAEFEPLRASFNTAADTMAQSMAEVTSVAAALHNGCSDIRQASDDLSSRTERQAASLEEAAAAIQEITQNVREAATLVETTESIVADTHRDAQSSVGVVEDTTQAMGGIERASQEIGDIIAVIDGIAFQTNLLALNAGVEAARAGDAGKGFAVVASEVRALAQRSAEAAKDVKARVSASTAQVDRGVELVANTGVALKRITDQMDRIRSLIGNIATSARQQADTLGQINIAVGEMDSITQHNAAMVEETTAAARSLADEAARLNDAVAVFRVGRADPRGTYSAPLRMVAGGRR